MLGIGLSVAKHKAIGKPPMQKWWDYPDSPVSSQEYPYQAIVKNNSAGTLVYLYLSKSPMFGHAGYENVTIESSTGLVYYVLGYPYNKTAAWGSRQTVSAGSWGGVNNGYLEANSDVFLNSSKMVVQFPKTTDKDKYQKWDGYAATPDSIAIYPYQAIIEEFGYKKLILSKAPIYIVSGPKLYINCNNWRRYYSTDNPVTSWGNMSDIANPDNVSYQTIHESNANIYTDSTLTAVYFAKTTT